MPFRSSVTPHYRAHLTEVRDLEFLLPCSAATAATANTRSDPARFDFQPFGDPVERKRQLHEQRRASAPPEPNQARVQGRQGGEEGGEVWWSKVTVAETGREAQEKGYKEFYEFTKRVVGSYYGRRKEKGNNYEYYCTY